ncbi:AraC family transcriptional regulator [Flavobacterium rakeshii]|uniref:helix-turn-helix domain-containing protein n=1 Tax=Flavobacterium rakeshii TaxID=1038845 RepID=UPI002E7C5148|nr:AraC family transcriptional regulator [Flavobacterium rakeshii]MEE1897397.1 AraC family transcriptional regulator [Flavobacterium rakeshii]
MEKIVSPSIKFSCYFTESRQGEHFIGNHALGFIVSGNTTFNDGNNSVTLGPGQLYFCRRNHLLKYVKTPETGGVFRSISVMFTQEMLREFSLKYGFVSGGRQPESPYQLLQSDSMLANYMVSLLEYESVLTQPGSPLLSVKQEEAILLLLKLNPELKDVLFDFSDPGKIDLGAFMEQNYHFNVGINRFAYLTGRSLSGFKRDFEKTFNVSPGKWLLQRRLKEAYYLLTEKKMTVSDIYPELGFEDMSHFSYAFKKKYGMAPSKI